MHIAPAIPHGESQQASCFKRCTGLMVESKGDVWSQSFALARAHLRLSDERHNHLEVFQHVAAA